MDIPNISNISSLANASNSVRAVTDVYTDLHGMQQLSSEKDSNQALKKVAQQFESMFINMMMKSMRQANAVFEEGSMFDSQESHFYRDMYDQQLSLSMAHKENGNGKGIGIADALYRQMSRNYLDADLTKDSATENSLSTLASDFSSEEMVFNDRRLSGPSPYDHPKSQFDGNLNLSGNSISLNIDRSATKMPLAQSPEEFVALLLPTARSAAKQLGVDEKVLLAQSALETGWGSKVLADSKGESTHNLFNIKAGPNWFGEAIELNASEVHKGEWVNEPSQFRQYTSVEKSFDDYVAFISNNERYSNALKSTTSNATQNSAQDRSRDYIENIHQAGYATDPNYSDKVMAVYKRVENIIENSSWPTNTQQLFRSEVSGPVGDRIKQAISTFNDVLK